ncbi:MAG: hypothetical protein JOY99_02750 [Sphingomonadaceae bacterium]|nr:hypothetical protein [Sphingomonadaceae bacterium]
MIRVLIGSILGGLAQFFVGFLFWGTPLSRLAFTVAPDAANAAVQTALAQNLTATGTGSYYVPWPDTAQGTILHGRGPVAMIFFNTGGFPAMSTGSLIAGLIISIASMLLLGLGFHAIGGRVTDFATRARIVVLVSVATVLYFTIGMPVFNYYMPSGYWIYLAISQLAGFVVGGLVLARWFLPGEPRKL